MLSSKDDRERNDAKLMIRAYKNPAKYVKLLKEEGYEPKIMLDFSGILLESLKEMNKKISRLVVAGEKIGNIIKLYREVLRKYPESMEFAGTAYSHCYFPVTPEEDWEYQIKEWRKTFSKLFGKKALERVKGFWLPEMGVPEEKKLEILIKLLKKFGYEWVFLPVEAVKGEKFMSFEERIKITSQPHLIRAGNESIVAIFKVKYDFIDQQAGCDAISVKRKCLQAWRIFKEINNKPALVVPASDGENGNVMMNEFFPQTFVPFFKRMIDKNIGSLTISEFLEKYYSSRGEIKVGSEVKVQPLGASWRDGHEIWLGEARDFEIKRKIEELSKRFHEIEESLKEEMKEKEVRKIYEEAKKALLLAETSCYVYWGVDFWFDQGERMIEFARKKIQELERFKKKSLY